MPFDDEKREKHESYGLLQFSRTMSSNGHNLFGSSIQHSNTMRLSLSEAEKVRHLNYDSYFPSGLLYEIEMSPTQFAELITSANVGSGVPVTIRWIRGKGQLAPCPAETKRLQFEQEFDRKVRKISENLVKLVSEVKTVLAKKSLLKEDREKLTGLAAKIQQDVESNIPFIASMFNEQMDKTVQEAKGETEAFFRNIVEKLGVEHLADELSKLIPALPNIQPSHESPQLPQGS